MGTRGITCVVKNGEFRVAQYGQWDHYPSGQGNTIAKFIIRLLNNGHLEEFNKKIEATRIIDSDELDLLWKSGGEAKHPQFSRDMGGEILEYILEQEPGLPLFSSIKFAGDSLFCEWGYVVDLDRNTLEVYKGFRKTLLNDSDRFFFLQDSSKEYYPIGLFKSFKFEDITTDTMSECEQPEEE